MLLVGNEYSLICEAYTNSEDIYHQGGSYFTYSGRKFEYLPWYIPQSSQLTTAINSKIPSAANTSTMPVGIPNTPCLRIVTNVDEAAWYDGNESDRNFFSIYEHCYQRGVAVLWWIHDKGDHFTSDAATEGEDEGNYGDSINSGGDITTFLPITQ